MIPQDGRITDHLGPIAAYQATDAPLTQRVKRSDGWERGVLLGAHFLRSEGKERGAVVM